jgi:phenylalanyl-tRNA synthetase beta chain
MQVSLEWLGCLVDITGLTAEEIAHALTMSGLEVEDIVYIKPKFTKVFTGKIKEIEQHPNADKLRIATVDYGQGIQKVVCGASNIKEGQLIPFAIEGATVFNRKDNTEFTLKQVKIRGVESSGMICSATELGLEGPEYAPFSEGILGLSDLDRFKGNEPDLGLPLEDVLELKEDIIIHTAPTANRGDQMSMRGIANEVAAIFNRPVNKPVVEVETNTTGSTENFEIEIVDEDTCQYYALGLVKDIKTKPSPTWMARRLEASGMRTINNIVDITNYVMLEFGQPLHAFDYAKVPEKKLLVRRAQEGEKITTLDSVERKLIPDNVLIATPERPVALAGVMGDESSEVDKDTTNLAIESAYFTPHTNRRNSRAIGLRTEACARFERGVDIKTVRLALERTMQLLVELAEGKTAGIFEAGTIDPEPVIVELRFGQVKRILGLEIPRKKCIEILKNLDFNLLEETECAAKFEVPSYRTQDVYREIDLIEEISRIYGYDKIPERIPVSTKMPVLPAEDVLSSKVKTILKGMGLNEIVTSSLVGYPLLSWCGIPVNEKSVVKVANPQSEEYTMLRQNMIPGILQVVKLNVDRDQNDIWIFDIGKTYFIERKPEVKDPGTRETMIIAGAISGDPQTGNWHTENKVDFYILKGIIENLFDSLGLGKRLQLKPVTDINYLHPGRSALIDILGKPKSINKEKFPHIGIIGQLHPELVKSCKIGQEVYLFEIDMNQLMQCIPDEAPVYKSIAQFPAVVRDLAFVAEETINYDDIVKAIKKASSQLLKEVKVFDVYTGEHVPEGSRSLAIRLTLQDPEATLTDDVVEAEVEKIREGLKKLFNVKFR